jgi:cell division transport system permease protein
MKILPFYIGVRAFQNMWRNLFPIVTTIWIITISALIFSIFSLIAFNLTSFLKVWEEKIEIIAYLKKGIPSSEVEPVLKNARLVEGVETVSYVSPSDAMTFMETRLGSQKDLLEGIQSTVLPSSFEIQLKKDYRDSTRIKEVVTRLKQFPQIEEVQYGQEWVESFSVIVHLVGVTQWILGGLLLAAMIFIVSNTLQLTLSSRREEMDVMHMVGASPAYIHVPLYIEGLIQGLLGAGLAILLLLLLYKAFFFYLPPSMEEWVGRIPILFLPVETMAWILLGGMILGLFGSFIASMRFMKYSE